MSKVQILLERLDGKVGTARQLADRLELDPQDSSFKRALKEGRESGRICETEVKHGPRKGERVLHPPKVASGFGGSIVHGIEKGPARVEAFQRMSANLSYQIGTGKAPGA